MQTERSKTIAEYHSAVRAYHEAVSQLNGLNKANFDRQWLAAEKCRALCDELRAKLEKLDGAPAGDFKTAASGQTAASVSPEAAE